MRQGSDGVRFHQRPSRDSIVSSLLSTLYNYISSFNCRSIFPQRKLKVFQIYFKIHLTGFLIKIPNFYWKSKVLFRKIHLLAFRSLPIKKFIIFLLYILYSNQIKINRKINIKFWWFRVKCVLGNKRCCCQVMQCHEIYYNNQIE